MKKLLLYLTLTLFAFACGENDEPQPTPPEPKPKPRLEIESIGIEATSARFELTTDIATAYCYTCVETTDDMQKPGAGSSSHKTSTNSTRPLPKYRSTDSLPRHDIRSSPPQAPTER